MALKKYINLTEELKYDILKKTMKRISSNTSTFSESCRQVRDA